MRRAVTALADSRDGVQRPLGLYLQGADRVARVAAAESIAARAGQTLLVADVGEAARAGSNGRELAQQLGREVRLRGRLLLMELTGALETPDCRAVVSELLRAWTPSDGSVLFAGERPWPETDTGEQIMLTLTLERSNYDDRRALWRESLAEFGGITDPGVVDDLAGRFRLTRSQTIRAVAEARGRIRLTVRPGAPADPAGKTQTPTLGREALFAAARAQGGRALAELARRIDPKHGWDDLVLPDETAAQLQELCQRVVHRERVLGAWGFDRKLTTGRGVSALFAGPSGTGKTMAAEVIARELGMALYAIDLAGVVSKYIGETEKNLDRIFTAAERANVVLFFDEADALFGKRSQVRDSHDRYANLEVSYLLQKIEAYDGFAILATNLRQNLDEAFARRMAFTVHFPVPGEASRRRIWEGIWPAETPLAADIDLRQLARQLALSGGSIRNMALAAAFLAAEDGSAVGMRHVWVAARREYQKFGKVLDPKVMDQQPLAGAAS